LPFGHIRAKRAWYVLLRANRCITGVFWPCDLLDTSPPSRRLGVCCDAVPRQNVLHSREQTETSPRRIHLRTCRPRLGRYCSEPPCQRISRPQLHLSTAESVDDACKELSFFVSQFREIYHSPSTLLTNFSTLSEKRAAAKDIGRH
jgi:hypothetical protein